MYSEVLGVRTLMCLFGGDIIQPIASTKHRLLVLVVRRRLVRFIKLLFDSHIGDGDHMAEG